jgi:hypothetical protein
MFFEFAPPWINVSQRFLKDILGILYIKTNCPCRPNEGSLSFSNPVRELFLITAGHESNCNGLSAKTVLRMPLIPT